MPSLTLRQQIKQSRHRLKWIQPMFFSTWLADKLTRLSLQSCSRKFVLAIGTPQRQGVYHQENKDDTEKMVLKSMCSCWRGTGERGKRQEEKGVAWIQYYVRWPSEDSIRQPHSTLLPVLPSLLPPPSIKCMKPFDKYYQLWVFLRLLLLKLLPLLLGICVSILSF